METKCGKIESGIPVPPRKYAEFSVLEGLGPGDSVVVEARSADSYLALQCAVTRLRNMGQRMRTKRQYDMAGRFYRVWREA